MATVALYGFYALAAYAAVQGYRASQIQQPSGGDQEGPRLSDVKAAGSSYGVSLGDVFGAARVDGNIIWSDDIIETSAVREVWTPSPQPNYYLKEYFYSVSFAVQLRRGEIEGIRRIWANNELVYSQAEDADADTLSASNTFAQYMTVYKGTDTQMQDPTIAAKEGIENTPAFRGTSYIVFEQLPLKNFLNNFPKLSFEVVQKGVTTGTQITRVSVDLSSIIQVIVARADINGLRVDTSGVSELVRGVNIGGSTYFESLAPLLAAYNIDAYQSGYKLRFRRIADADVIDIDAADLGRDGKSGYSLKTKLETKLPRSKTITYFDFDRDYLAGTQDARRKTGRARNDEEITTTLSLTATEAKQMAETSLYAAWIGRIEYLLKLPPMYLGIEPGDIVRLTVPNVGLLIMRLTDVTLGADNAIEADAESWSGTVLESNAIGHSGQETDGTITRSGNTTLQILDIAALTDALAAQPYLIIGASGVAPWRSATLYRSIDNRLTYQPALTMPSYSALGTTLTTLPNGKHTVWDTASTVDITLLRGSPQSATDSAVLAGANLACIGDELIQFATATLIAPGQWRLSRLLRGRRGTDWAKTAHGVGERVALLNTVYALQMAIAELNAVRWWRAPSQDQQLSDSAESSTIFQGNCLKPYSPVYVRAARNVGADLSITWIRRSRINDDPPTGDIPLGEASERYEVEVMNGAAAVRSTIVTSPAFVYTSAMQVADFGSNQAAVTVNIFQLSESIGRGYAATKTL